MKVVDAAVLSLAILSIVFGILGFTGAVGGHPSPISLYAGGGAGILLIGSLALAKTNPRVGRIGAAVICLLLLGRFVGPAIKGTIYPAGIMAVASLLTLGVLVNGHLQAVAARKRGENPSA